MRAVFALVMVAMLGLGCQGPVQARDLGLDVFVDVEQIDRSADLEQLAQDQDVGIPPSEAAAIARDQVPGAKVVGVKLLSNGWYAVTLRSKGSVTRVMVNATDGSVR